MSTLKEAAERFLSLEKLAVAGVSSKKKDSANYIYEKLKKAGKQVYAINPNAKEVEGDPCYPNLSAAPVKIDGVVIGTHPKATLSVIEECVALGIKHVWIHKAFDNGSYNEAAEKLCRENGIELIPAACPMMFVKPVDFAHKCIKWILLNTGKIPRTIEQ